MGATDFLSARPGGDGGNRNLERQAEARLQKSFDSRWGGLWSFSGRQRSTLNFFDPERAGSDCFAFVFKTLCLGDNPRFTAKLSGRYRFPIHPCPHSCMALHWVCVPRGDPLVTAADDTHGRLIITPKSSVHSGLHSWWWSFYGFGQKCDVYV